MMGICRFSLLNQKHFDTYSILEKRITLKGINLLKLTYLLLIKMDYFDIYSFFKFGFTPCKAEQPLQGLQLQEKEEEKD